MLCVQQTIRHLLQGAHTVWHVKSSSPPWRRHRISLSLPCLPLLGEFNFLLTFPSPCGIFRASSCSCTPHPLSSHNDNYIQSRALCPYQIQPPPDSLLTASRSIPLSLHCFFLPLPSPCANDIRTLPGVDVPAQVPFRSSLPPFLHPHCIC